MITTYPVPGTNAEKILEFVQANPTTTRYGIISKLEMNPGVVKKAMVGLIDAGLVKDVPDAQGHHHYTSSR